jgi:hypothetical protein
MPAIVDDADDLALIASRDLTPLVPSGASYASRSALRDPIEQIVLTWFDGSLLRRRNGLIVWQRSEDESWHAVYAFTDPGRLGVFGIRVEAGELTGDAIPDILSFEDVGGSGACGTYRVIATAAGDASEIFRRDVCDTQIAISAVTFGSARPSSTAATRIAARARSASRPCAGAGPRGTRSRRRSSRTTPPGAERPIRRLRPYRPVARPPADGPPRNSCGEGLTSTPRPTDTGSDPGDRRTEGRI